MDDDTTNQVVSEGATVDDTDTIDTTGVEQTDDQQFDDDGNLIEDQAEDEDEIELDEETKFKLPKSLAEKVRQAMLRQGDYTKKTQDLAEERKALAAERETVTKASEEELNARAAVISVSSRIGQLDQLAQQNGGWLQWKRDDPFTCDEAKMERDLLMDAGNKAHTYAEGLKQQRTLQEQQDSAKRLEEGHAELARAIPEWSPDYSAKLMNHAMKDYGFTREDLDGIDDPRTIKVLHAAYQWSQHQSKTKKAATVQQQQKVVPAAKVGSGAAAIAPGKLDDRLSAEEWIRRRNAQVAKRGGR